MLKDSYIKFLILFLMLFVSCDLSAESKKFRVLGVIDGDTVIINHPKAKRLRYTGINAPENLNAESPGDPFYLESTLMNKRLVGGRDITIEFDQEKYDPYGRVLGYVFVDGVFVNEELVKEGLARSFFIEPNTKYKERILKAEDEAKKYKRGIWSNPRNFITPSANGNFLIKPLAAKDYIDQRVVVRGKVNELRKKNSKVIVLTMEEDLDLVIFSDNLSSYEFFGIDPANYYLGKPVEVIGRVSVYRGRPQIIISHPITIKVLE